MKKIPPEVRLERLVEALSEDVILASDAEILEACADLKIRPDMKGSIAFLGLKKGHLFFPYRPEKLAAGDGPAAWPQWIRREQRSNRPLGSRPRINTAAALTANTNRTPVERTVAGASPVGWSKYMILMTRR